MRSRPLLGSAVLAALVSTGCLEHPIQTQDPRSTAMVVERIKLSAVERIDLLLAIDNSGSMADKQKVLELAVPELVKRLANPRCVDASGEPIAGTPASPTDPCPAGSQREFLAVPDIHIGIVSSSLGGPDGATSAYCTKGPQSDKGHLLNRTSTGTAGTYEGLGFLAWDPDKKLDPPGETVLDAGNVGLIPTLQDMVVGVGEAGCGFEGQLESWYRFLIQPDPYAKLVQDGDDLVPSGVDETLLAQRKAFLRPDSLVAILMLTDENDCSIAPGAGAARVFNKARMIKPRTECETKGPNDACCAPCDEIPDGCPVDDSCKTDGEQIARLGDDEDHIDLRCFDQKRRFGKDYLYPLERYTAGLTELHVPDRHGNLTSNPLFMDLDLTDDLHGPRSPALVYLAGIVGVPWQDIAKDPTTLLKGLKSAKELATPNEQGQTTWDVILGDPRSGKMPLDPHMIESTKPRAGLPASDAAPDADPITGHEQPTLISHPQYACTFPLLSPRENSDACETSTGEIEVGDPLCQDASGNYTKTQLRAPAYPGLRELGVLKGVGEQAIVASVCPANMDVTMQEKSPDFGYTPAIGALIDQLKGQLGHQCLQRQLTPDAAGQVGCFVLEARKSDSCSCESGEGRAPLSDEHINAVQSARNSGQIDDTADCFCEVPQLEGDELDACQFQEGDPLVVDGAQVNGWCYIDGSSVPKVGSPDLVPAACASAERRLVRLLGNAKPHPASTVVIMCIEG